MAGVSFYEVYGGNLDHFLGELSKMDAAQSRDVLMTMIDFLRIEAPRSELQWMLQNCGRYLSHDKHPRKSDYAEILAATIITDEYSRKRVNNAGLIRKTEARLNLLKTAKSARPSALSKILSEGWGIFPLPSSIQSE